MNFFFQYQIFVFEKIPSYFISETDCYYKIVIFFYKLIIGYPLELIPMYLDSQIWFTYLLIQHPPKIFLTIILTIFTQWFHNVLYYNRNITSFQIPKNEYWLFIIQKYLDCNYVIEFSGSAFLIYVKLIFYFYLIFFGILNQTLSTFGEDH
jgi:hypothetical protein